MRFTKEEELLFAVDSLRSARSYKQSAQYYVGRGFDCDKESLEYWKRQCRIRRAYVQDLEEMYKIKYHQIF